MIEIERSFAVTEVEQIDVRIGLGDIRATAGGQQIQLRAQVRSSDEEELETTVAGGVLTIKNRASSGWMGRNSGRIDLVLSIPHDAPVALAAATGMGDVNIENIAGLREVHTGKGDVRAAGGSSSLSIKTGKGDVTVRTWRGDLQITTGKGDVAVSDLVGGLQMTTGAGDTAIARWQAGSEATHQIKTGAGDVAVSQGQAHRLEVKTGRGDCTLQQVSLRRLDAHTGMGSLRLAGDPLGGQWEARTGKGDLSLALPAGIAARIEAATRHGSIHSELPQVKVARPGPASQHGGRTIVVLGEEPRAEIRLETIKGDIVVRGSGAMPAAVAPVPTRVTVEPPVPPAPPAPAASPAPPAPQVTAMSVLESLARSEISVDEAKALLRSLEQ